MLYTIQQIQMSLTGGYYTGTGLDALMGSGRRHRRRAGYSGLGDLVGSGYSGIGRRRIHRRRRAGVAGLGYSGLGALLSGMGRRRVHHRRRAGYSGLGRRRVHHRRAGYSGMGRRVKYHIVNGHRRKYVYRSDLGRYVLAKMGSGDGEGRRRRHRRGGFLWGLL